MGSDHHRAALERVVGDLQASVEQLDDLATEVLREAIDAGEQVRPELERIVVRARNALERSIGLLRRAAEHS